METEIRSGDTEVHPAAIEREAEAVEDARQKRLRFYAGALGVTLCAVAFLVALWRDQHIVLAGAFVGGLVAGNVIPHTMVRDVIMLRLRGSA